MIFKEELQILKNEKGNYFLISILLLLLLSLTGLKLIANKLDGIAEDRYRFQQFLCLKEYTGETKRHIGRMEALNKGIILGKSLQGMTILFPILRPLLILEKYGNTSMKGLQQVQHFSYLKNYPRWMKKGCYFSPNYLKTPYKHKGKLLRHKVLETTILRKKEWKQTLFALRTKEILLAKIKTKKKIRITTKSLF